MRFVFHAMLGVSLVVASAGIVLGAQARRGHEDAATGPSHTAALRHAPHEHAALEQTIAPPLPVSPRFGAEVGAGPTLSWRLPAGTDGARVELCPTSDFADETTRRVDVPGEELRLPAQWPAGVWYWRLRGREQGAVGDRATPTWMVYVTPDGSSAS
ncbi:MAG TPA: hypothetical protein VIY73_07180 [Polyangiaceae bacterium]